MAVNAIEGKHDKLKKVFDEYGSGIIAYFKFLKNLCYIYLAMCCMIAPIGYVYSKHDGLKGMENYFLT